MISPMSNGFVLVAGFVTLALEFKKPILLSLEKLLTSGSRNLIISRQQQDLVMHNQPKENGLP